MQKPKKLLIGMVLIDVLTNGRLEIVNITAENIDGWSTYLELKREDGSQDWYALRTLMALINSDLIVVAD